jgi:methylmalonyl-CoA mutase cobalamin-binding subunit
LGRVEVQRRDSLGEQPRGVLAKLGEEKRHATGATVARGC